MTHKVDRKEKGKEYGKIEVSSRDVKVKTTNKRWNTCFTLASARRIDTPKIETERNGK